MFDRHNNISIFLYIAILLNAIIIALFITFVFGLKKDAFDIDTKKLDRTSLICQNNILSLVNDYDNRLDKIIESYNFPSLLQNVVLNGMNEDEKNRIISIFRSGNYAFDTVGLYFADGRAVFSSPDNRKSINLNALKVNNKKAFFDQDFDGVYFVKPIKNERGIEVGYIIASVFKKIFENTSYNLNFLLIPNGVIYYNPSININSISRDTLYQYMNNPGIINIGAYSYILHSSSVKDIYNFNVGILELDVPVIQKYLKYVLLVILTSSLIFLISSVIYEKKKLQAINVNEEDDDNLYSEDDIIEDNEYDNFDDDESNLDDFNYDLNILNEDIEYLNKIESKNKKHINKENKLELPNLDDIDKESDNNEDLFSIEDLENIEDSINEDEAIKIDDVDNINTEDEHLNITDNLEDIEESINEDEAIKIDDVDNINDEHLNIADNLEDIEDSINEDEAIKIDDVDNINTEDEHLNIADNLEDIEDSINEEDAEIPNIDNLGSSNISEEDKELDYVPTLDNVLEENDDEYDDKNIIRGIDDIISDNEEDILISHGSIIDDEISKKEDDYFSSLDSFNLALNKDFLFDNNDNTFDKSYDNNEIIKKASEDDVFDTEDLIDSELYDPEEKRPPMPDDYKDAEEKVKDNMTSNWKNILKAIKGEKFVNKNLDEMLEWIKEKSGLNILHSILLSKNDEGIYKITDSRNINDDTKNKLEIDENEALFKKILSSKKTLYVSDPFSSLSLKIKFDEKDRENVSHMIFIPIQDEEGSLKSFFIGLSSN